MNISRRKPAIVMYGFDNNMGLDMAYSRKSVIANQFIFSKSPTLYIVTNKSWYTVYFMPFYIF